jgi:hypothetical protein
MNVVSEKDIALLREQVSNDPLNIEYRLILADALEDNNDGEAIVERRIVEVIIPRVNACMNKFDSYFILYLPTHQEYTFLGRILSYLSIDILTRSGWDFYFKYFKSKTQAICELINFLATK